MIYKLEDGDVLKLLPMLRKSGGLELVLPVDSVFLENKIIYDLSGKDYLRKMTFSSKASGNSITLSKKYFLSIYVDGLIKFISVGKSIMDIISPKNFDVRKDDHLHVKINMIDNIHYTQLRDYKSSCIVNKIWARPNIDINNSDEWLKWIKSNQPYYIEDFLEKQSIFNNIDIIKRSYGEHFLSEIISDDRNKKIETILN